MPVPAGASVPADLSGNSEAKQRVISGLQWIYDHHFEDQDAGYYGNWFNWEIANPTHISQTLALLHDDLESSHPELAQQYVDRSEEHTSELQSRGHLVCRLLLDINKR